jgi:hypothetical protein
MMSAFHLPDSKNKVRTLCRMLLGINQQEDSVKEKNRSLGNCHALLRFKTY